MYEVPTDRDRAISRGTEFRARLWELTLAMLDHLDAPDPPSKQYCMPPSTNYFGTYAEARRMFGTVLTEEFSPRSQVHRMFIQDYCDVLRWDIGKDMSFLRSLGHGDSADNRHVATVLARWDSWQAVEQRWPYRVPRDCSAVTKEELEAVCREMWTALRIVGRAALVLGEGKPGDAAFICTADGYCTHDGGVSNWSLDSYGSHVGSVGAGVGARKSIKQD